MLLSAIEKPFRVSSEILPSACEPGCAQSRSKRLIEGLDVQLCERQRISRDRTLLTAKTSSVPLLVVYRCVSTSAQKLLVTIVSCVSNIVTDRNLAGTSRVKREYSLSQRISRPICKVNL